MTYSRVVAELRRELGPVDLLVNNAGIVGPIGPMWEVELDSWWRAMEVNVRGVLIGTQLVLPDMVARGGGRVINMPARPACSGGRRCPGTRCRRRRSSSSRRTSRARPAAYGVSVFSVHPGLLPIGMSETGIVGPRAADSYAGRIRSWVMRELAKGRGADPESAHAS